MTERVSVTNQKGGVGKTTVAAHLAVGLARTGYEVLAIDLDPQAYLTKHFGLRNDLYREPIDNIALHLVGEGEGEPLDLIERTDEGVELVPSNFDMRGAEEEVKNMKNRGKQLDFLLEDLEKDYDYVVIDTPPNLGILTDNAIVAAMQVLIPVQAEDTSINAIEMTFDEIQEIQDAYRDEVKILGIVPNLVRNDGVAETTLEYLRSHDTLSKYVTPFEIRQRVDIKYAMRQGTTLYTYNSDSDMVPVFNQLVETVEKGTQGVEATI